MAEDPPLVEKSLLIAPKAGLEGLAAAARSVGGTESRGKRLPPVEQWNPPFCGDIDMRIARDGTWFYNGTPIGRAPLVRLFSTILRKDPERYVLVTPVERVGIRVEDAPFIAVEMQVGDANGIQTLRFRTNVEDWVDVDAQHPLRFEKAEADGLKPYVRIRDDLWALVKRSLFFDLAELGVVENVDGKAFFGVTSAGTFFAMAEADSIEGLREAT